MPLSEQEKKQIKISIHALRVEGDEVPCVRLDHLTDISIHALRVEGDVIQ